MRILTIFICVVLVVGCATQRYGRLTSVSPAERRHLDCGDIEIEIAKAEHFISEVQLARSETTGAHVLGFLGDFGIGNVMEGDAAEASGRSRLRELRALHAERDC